MRFDWRWAAVVGGLSLVMCGLPSVASAAITVSLTPSQGSWMAQCNAPVTLTAQVAGGSGSTSYKFAWRKTPNGPTGDSGSFGTSATWSWTPQWTGQYTLAVTAKKGSEEATKEITNYVVAFPPVTLSVTPTANVTTSTAMTASTTAVTTCVHSQDAVKYKFLSRRQAPGGSWDGWRTIADWGSATTATFQPSGDGSMVVQVRAGILSGSQILTEGAKNSDTIAVQAGLGVASVAITPSSIFGGDPRGAKVLPNVVITLTTAAPAGGVVLPVTSSHPNITAGIPANVTIPAGQKVGQFWIDPPKVANDTTVTVTAGQGAMAKGGTILMKSPSLEKIQFRTRSLPNASSAGDVISPSNPATIVGDGFSGNTLGIEIFPDIGGPPGGMTVALTSSDPVIPVPSTVTIAENYANAAISVQPLSVTSDVQVTITATHRNVTKQGVVTVKPRALEKIALKDSGAAIYLDQGSLPSLRGGRTLWMRLFLNGRAGASGFTVPLASSNTTAVPVPASVTLSSGSTWTDVQVVTPVVAQDTTVTITAGQGAQAKTASIVIQATAVASVAIDPQSLTGGGSTAGLVTLNGPAPASGLVVPLSSSIASATVPASVTIPSGQWSATFQVTTQSVTANTSGTITAGQGASAKSTSILLRP